jgi:hypothetical protein
MSSTAAVSVWAKGFRVSRDSEEFQLVVPGGIKELDGAIERELARSSEWPRVLEALYMMDEERVSAQWALLLSKNEITAIRAAGSQDRQRRPSVTVVAATFTTSWNERDLSSSVSNVQSLAVQLSMDFSKAFQGAPEKVARQLRDGRFVSTRVFDIDARDNRRDDRKSWDLIVQSIKRWNGITGIATPAMVSLGANIVFGTEHEARVLSGRTKVDGYCNVHDRAIVPLTSTITLWPDVDRSPSGRSDSDGHLAGRQENHPSPEWRMMEPHFLSMEAMISEMFDAIERLGDRLDTWFGRGGRDNRRKR